jgi:ribosomal protein S18 acetylase RimI-like enzyme
MGGRTSDRAVVSVRDLRWEDFSALTEGYYALYEERQSGAPIGITLFAEKPSLANEVDWFSGLYKSTLSGSSVALVAEVDGRAVGLCTVRGLPAPGEGSHVGVLGILVHRADRGHGIGEELFRQTIERCRGKFEMIVLDLFADNVRAKALYLRHGFRSAGTIPNGIKRGNRYIDHERMYLPLL